MTMLQAQVEAAPQAQPATPTPPATTGQSLEQTINDAIQQSISGALQGKRMTAEDRARLRQEIRDAVSQAQAARSGIPMVQVNPFPHDIIPPQAVDISVAFFFTVAAIVIGLPIARAIGRRMDRRAPAPAADVSTRLDRIEQAIEAVAIEVERVSEGQRFTNKVMSDFRALPAGAPAEQWPANAARRGEPVPVPATEQRR